MRRFRNDGDRVRPAWIQVPAYPDAEARSRPLDSRSGAEWNELIATQRGTQTSESMRVVQDFSRPLQRRAAASETGLTCPSARTSSSSVSSGAVRRRDRLHGVIHE